MAASVKATEFVRNFARYQHEAIRAGVVLVTNHDRIVGGYLSADELARFERLKAREREVLSVGELDDQTEADIATARYGVEAG